MKHSLSIIAIGIYAVAVCELDGQTPTPTPPNLSPPFATVAYNATQTVVARCQNQAFQLVGLQPDQVVQVTIACPPEWIASTVDAEVLDTGVLLVQGGGTTKSLSFSVDGSGNFTLSFQAGHNRGRNQIAIRKGTQELGLQFWISQTDNPDDDPSALRP